MLQKIGEFSKMFLYSYNIYIGIYIGYVNFIFPYMINIIVLQVF